MVNRLAPEENISGNLENSLRENMTFPQIKFTAHISQHPGLRGSPRIRFRAKVNEAKWPIIRLIDPLENHLIFDAETEMERIDLVHHIPQGRLEDSHVQIAVNLQVLTCVIDRAFPQKALVMPDTKLPCRQLPLPAPGS
jgi:hypothetical protein